MSGKLARIGDWDVRGDCPACGHPVLFVGEGGYITCSLIDCPDPEAVTKLLSGPLLERVSRELESTGFTDRQLEDITKRVEKALFGKVKEGA